MVKPNTISSNVSGPVAIEGELIVNSMADFSVELKPHVLSRMTINCQVSCDLIVTFHKAGQTDLGRMR